MFGPMIPVLFPIAALSLTCLYVTEKLAMAYSYKKPPMYDNQVTLFTLKALRFAPILYAITASWAFSNQQVFRNSVVLNDTKNLYPYSGHHVSQFLTQLTPASVWLLVIPFTVINLILSKIGCNALSCCHPKSKLVKCIHPVEKTESDPSVSQFKVSKHFKSIVAGK